MESGLGLKLNEMCSTNVHHSLENFERIQKSTTSFILRLFAILHLVETNKNNGAVEQWSRNKSIFCISRAAAISLRFSPHHLTVVQIGRKF